MHHFYCFTYNFWALHKGKDASKHAWNLWLHYNAYLMVYHHNDVTMGAKASQITSLTIVNSIVYSDADQRNLKALRHWSLCAEFTGDRSIPHTNGQLRGKCFHLMTSSCSSIFSPDGVSLSVVIVAESSTVLYICGAKGIYALIFCALSANCL